MTFDGFHELLETLEMQSKEERDKAHILLDILMNWAAKSSNNAHIVFIGENPFGEELLLQSKLLLR